VKQPAVMLLVRFRSHLSRDEVLRVAEERAPEFRALTGLAQKYYLGAVGQDEYAGLYLWESPADLGKFAESELRAAISDVYQMDGEPRIEAYEVITQLRS
jgi:hypothetical protein